jgi:broad specificity phosphatase PhoE
VATKVVLVRHGETEWSRDKRHTGRTDLPLTDKGRQQAAALEAPLSAWKFALVLSSPLQRALETCRLAGYGGQAQVRPELMEWDYGRYEGLTSRQIAEENPGWSLWRDGGLDGEKPADVGRRVDRVISDIVQVAGNVLIFAHGHVLRVLTARWLAEPPAGGRHYALKTATLSVLGYEHENPVISRWNLPPNP